jgi:hypothetical protein
MKSNNKMRKVYGSNKPVSKSRRRGRIYQEKKKVKMEKVVCKKIK